MIRVVHADALLLGDGTSIRDGALVLDAVGTILDVGPAYEVRARATGAVVERLHGLLLPGLINAHTHLELSGLRGKTRSGAGFVPWLASLQKARAEELEEERDAAMERAIAHLVEVGVVAVGEVTNSLASWRKLARHLRGTIFHEVFSLDRERGLAQVAAMPAMRSEMEPIGDGRTAFRYATVPHALYSTHPDVVRALAAHDGPLSFHLAEHAAERAFLRDGQGPWRAFLEGRGLASAAAAFPVRDRDPISLARELGLLRRDTALVHLTDARAQELDVVAERGAIAVLCPRSNLHIETRLPPAIALCARGVTLAIGTDSLASSASLDPLAEARALADRMPEVPAAVWIAAATSGAARAIGWGEELGRLAIGKRPGVLHVAGSIGGDVDPSAWLLREIAAPRNRVAVVGSGAR